MCRIKSGELLWLWKLYAALDYAVLKTKYWISHYFMPQLACSASDQVSLSLNGSSIMYSVLCNSLFEVSIMLYIVCQYDPSLWFIFTNIYIPQHIYMHTKSISILKVILMLLEVQIVRQSVKCRSSVPGRVKPMTYKMDTCHFLAWYTALIG